jgi:hypothetical protein
VALVVEDAEGNTTVKETGDHLGRKGLEIGGGLGLVVGLFSPPLFGVDEDPSGARGDGADRPVEAARTYAVRDHPATRV